MKESSKRNMVSTKQELLKKYSERNPKRFIQYDGFVHGADSVSGYDPDDDAIFGGTETAELMHGSSVRVLIKPETEKHDVVRLLSKISNVVDQRYNAEKRNPDIVIRTNLDMPGSCLCNMCNKDWEINITPPDPEAGRSMHTPSSDDSIPQKE